VGSADGEDDGTLLGDEDTLGSALGIDEIDGAALGNVLGTVLGTSLG
jgi:hypothetical protein